MPRFALALTLLAGCFFDADYRRAHLRCSDDSCPAGLHCVADTCTTGSAGGDAGGGSADARMPLLTCGDPGDASAGIHMDSTDGHVNLLSTSCGGAIYNGPETVYRIEGPGPVTIGIDDTLGLDAYVIGACSSFPTCETNTAATPSAPLAITLTSGMHLVVVDGLVAGVTGTYTLEITR